MQLKVDDVDVAEWKPEPTLASVTGGQEAMRTPATAGGDGCLPSWVPEAAMHYLEHVEVGLPIRALARRADVHASTILRQVRRLESRRDDPLVDAALRQLSRCLPHPDPHREEMASMHSDMNGPERARVMAAGATLPGTDRIEAEALRVLRRLSETGAVLAVAKDMEVAVVVRDGADDQPQRLASLDRAIAEAMALKDWISCADPGARVARYRITGAGRSALRQLMSRGGADGPERPDGFAEAQAGFAMPGDPVDAAEPADGNLRHMRSALAESPLSGLARRRDRDGMPFLSRDLVASGERLREDFELAQMGPSVTQDWSRFLTGPDRGAPGGTGMGASDARGRVVAALAELGPGLGDVALRCCCYLEGMESLERRMGWSARSGKIVLRIALQRLKRHYDVSSGGSMIG